MYQIIDNLPIDYQFSTKTKEELKLYGVWFNENKDKRILYLIETVKATQGFENWNADFTPNSLKELGKWLSQNVEIEKIPEAQYNIKRTETPSYIEINDWDLTIKTRSLLVDSGIYFGEVFIKEHKNLKWKQYFSKIKKDVNNGHVIIKFKIRELNPIWILYILGLGLGDKTKGEHSLFDLYKVWEKYL
jgi:hypothetical protein